MPVDLLPIKKWPTYLVRNKDDKYKDLSFSLRDRGSSQRPYKTGIKGLAIYSQGATHKGILLCNYQGLLSDDTDPSIAGSYFSAANLATNVKEVPIDALRTQLSSALVHKMIHLGDMTQCKIPQGRINVHVDKK